ncbi:MAG: TonB-dependent receptor [Flavobacteriales bacterium]|nr:TonB-dependent receptor [Flavobacteriales bacterium]
MKRILTSSITICLLFLSVMANAQQTGKIKGFVYDKENGEPVLFTNVIVKGTTLGAATDVNGYYTITNVPVGEQTVQITYLGYDTLTSTITVDDDRIASLNLYLVKSSVKLNEVQISADRQEALTEVRTSVTKLTPKEMKQIPTVSGESDLAQVLQVQPGIVFTGDQGGQLYIRGGSPIQNKVLLDGMIVYNPFHSIGFFSVFETDIIKTADIYTGGYNAEFGDRVSSIMDIKTRDGNRKKFAGKLSFNPFGANLLLEGPIIKMKEDRGGSLTYLVSGKTSYLKYTSKVLYPYVNDGQGLPFNFTDIFAKMTYSANSGSKINLFGFSFNDQVTYQSINNYKWNSFGVGTNVLIVPSGSQVLLEPFFNYSSYRIELTGGGSEDTRFSQIGGFNGGMNFTYYFGKSELKFGPFLQGFQTRYEFTNSVGQQIGNDETQNTTDFGVYAKFKWSWRDKIVIEPSFRVHYYASLGVASPEPRLGAKWNITKWLRMKYAFGLFAQNMISANSDRDVVNLFYGFLTAPENLPKTFDGKEIKNPLDRAMHNIVGFEFDLGKRISVNVEGYMKHFLQLSNVNRNKLFADNAENTEVPDGLKKDFIIETGKAMGLDFVVKYAYKRLYMWAVYSLSKVDRYDGITTYFPFFDRRHNVNLVAAYTFGKNLNWEASVRWNLGSGFPFTQTAGFYENLVFDGGINTDYTTQNGTLGVEYGELNKGRLPYYHRLDLSVKRSFELGPTTLDAVIGITNVYNRENIFYIDRVRYERVNQLPILPSLGLSWQF